MIEIPSALIDAVKERKAVLVAGMGLGRQGKPPGWEGLLGTLIDWVEDETVKSDVRALCEAGQRTAALAALAARLGDEVIGEILKDAYPGQLEKVGKIPDWMAGLAAIPWRGVITTAWDAQWDVALAAASDPAAVFLPPGAAALDRHRGRFLLHLFGSTAAPDTLALAPADLRRKLGPTGVADALRALHRRWSFVFVGFAPGDPDLEMVAERLLGAQASEARHFLLYPGRAGFAADALGADLGMVAVPFEGPWADLLRALGDAWAAAGGDAPPADDDVEAWLAAWRRDPSDHRPRAALARAEVKLRGDGQWERLLALHLARAEHLTEREEIIAERRAAARLGDEQLGDPARAFASLLPAFRLDPEDAALRAELGRLARAAKTWDELIVELTEIAVGLGSDSRAARHWAEIGRAYAEELGQADNAIGSYQQALAVDRAHPGALAALRTLLAARARWSELGPVLAASAEAAEGTPDEAGLRLELGRLLATRLGDSDGALVALERAFQIAPASPEVLDALEEHYRARERWSDVARVLETKAAAASDAATAARLRQERARLLVERLGDVNASIATMEGVLARAPDDASTLRQLETLYQKAGRDDDALGVLERLTTLGSAPAERVSLLRRLAAGLEGRPADLDRAAAALEQILSIQSDDEEAFRALCRLHRRARRWTALAEALRRRLELTQTAAERQEHEAALGKLYEEELGDGERALGAYQAAAAAGDQRETTWEALCRLHEQQKHWRLCADALDRLAELASDPALRCQAHFRAGILYRDKLDDRVAAEERFGKALLADAGHAPALAALASLYHHQGQHLRAAKLMIEASERTPNRNEKTRLLHEAGTLFEDRLDDPARATALYADVLAIDPEHVLSAERLVELHTRAEAWTALEPILEMLARKVAPGNAALAADVQARLGFAAHKLGKLDKAQRCYEAAYRLAPDALPVLAGFAELAFERQSWKHAGELLRALVERHGKELPRPQLLDVYARLGACDARGGEPRAALGHYQKALALEPNHRPSIEAMAEIHLGLEDWVALLLDKRSLVAMAESEEKLRLLEEIAALYADRLHNPGKAIAAFQSVLALAPDRRPALRKLLELYTAAKQWPRAADTLVHMASLDEQPAVRAKYLYAAAVIQRDEMNDRAQALALLDRALDESPELSKAFDAIERITSEIGDWRELARSYRRMIKRLPPEGHDAFRLRLWNGLGEVALQRLGDRALGTTALEVASTLDPGDIKRHEQLAELYLQAGPDQIDKAIREHQLLIAANPDRLSAYRALCRLYQQAGQADKRWCVAATLSFLRKADPETEQFYETHRPPELRPAQRSFSDELWPRIVHRDEDPFVAAIFMLVGHFVAATTAQQHQAIGIKRKDRADVGRDERPALRVLRYVSETLGLPAPDLFFTDAETHSLSMLNLQEKGVLTPALLIGQEFAARSSEADLVFELGKRLAFLRPERFLRSALPSPGALDITLRAAMALAGAPIGNGAHNGEVDRLTDHLRRLVPRPAAEQLAMVGRKLQAARGEVINPESWMAAADMTAARVGFVLAGDVGLAARVTATEPPSASPLPARQRLRDLLAYSVSEDYFAVRKFLGLEVM